MDKDSLVPDLSNDLYMRSWSRNRSLMTASSATNSTRGSGRANTTSQAGDASVSDILTLLLLYELEKFFERNTEFWASSDSMNELVYILSVVCPAYELEKLLEVEFSASTG